MSDFKLRPFDYEEKETYSHDEVKKMFKDNNEYFNSAYSKKESEYTTKITELETKNSEYFTKERSRTLGKIAKEISVDNFEKILKYTKVDDDADEATIRKAMEETAKDFLPVITNTAKPKVEAKGEVKKEMTKKEDKQYRFVK